MKVVLPQSSKGAVAVCLCISLLILGENEDFVGRTVKIYMDAEDITLYNKENGYVFCNPEITIKYHDEEKSRWMGIIIGQARKLN